MDGWGFAIVLLLAGCGSERAPEQASAGARLEAVAVRRGLVPDPERALLIGAWARDNDRACVVPLNGGRQRVGLVLDYGEGNRCVASGTLARSGDRLRIDLGACRVEARFDGERISFPAEVDADCARLCTGNATLDAFTVERVSEAEGEARSLRSPDGRALCAD